MAKKIHKLFNWLGSFLLSPFKEELTTYILLCYLAAVPLAVIAFPSWGLKYSIYQCALGSIICYPIVLLLHLIPEKDKKVVAWAFYLIGICNVVCDILVHTSTGYFWCKEQVALIMGTNIHESTEFFESYLNAHNIALIFAFLGLFFFLYFILKWVNNINKYISYTLAIIFVGMLGFTNVLKSSNWSEIYICKFIEFFKYKPAVNLENYRMNPDIVFCETREPSTDVILIIGESLHKKHCSLYGNEQETNPLLGKKVNEDNLYVFKNVQAAATHTIPAFKKFMSTYDGETEKDYFQCLNLIDLSQKCGFSCSWISNQSRVGAYDNIVTSYAHLTDYAVWIGDDIAGTLKYDYDELVLPMIDSLQSENHDHITLTIVHLLGSHETFKRRYPDSFNVFKPEDYCQYPDNQRILRAEYDNSVLYNDFVVSSIMDKYSDKNSIVLYFSDHGLDIFDSDPSFLGHAKDTKPTSVEAAIQIPFMIYCSDIYKSQHPKMMKKIRANIETEFNTTNFIYTLADLFGIDSIDGEYITDKSLFRER